MSDHRLEWSPEPKPVVPEIVAAVDGVEARLIGFDGFGSPVHGQVLVSEPVTNTYRMPILTRFDCELAGFDLDAIRAAYRMESR